MSQAIAHYIFIYFFYGFCGWLGESVYCSVPAKKWINRGFLTGPICPIYGTGIVVFSLLLMPVKHLGHPILVFLCGIVVSDIVEFVTSYVMEKLFHARWWDYSDKFMNLQGRICLQHSFYWGIAAIAYIYPVRTLVEGELLVEIPQNVIYTLDIIFCCVFLLDFANAVRKALDIKKISDKMSGMAISIANFTNSISESFSAFASDFTKQMDEIENQFDEFLDFDDKRNKLKNRMYKSYPFLKDSSMSELEKVRELLKAFISNKNEML